jgi:A/G-specific adenine glycosylase
MPLDDDLLRMLEAYPATARALPWRQTRDPYAILVSEVMLQQTRVDKVLPYYQRFLGLFPDWASLARADTDALLAAWSGLGYYRRVRNLQSAARAVLELGGVPQDEDDLRRLPGVGPYTAAAVCSIAFNRPALALDGNTLRVLTRYFGLSDDPSRPSVRRDLTLRVLPAIPPGRAADLTQALIELGATVCLPQGAPDCEACPLAPGCQARAEGRTRQIPPPRKRRRTERLLWATAVLVRGGRVLLGRNQREGILEDLWECPGVDARPTRSPLQALQDHLESLGLSTRLHPLGEVRHAITFRSIRCQVFQGRIEGDVPLDGNPDWAWVSPEELGARPVPSSTRKILELAAQKSNP